MAGVNKVILVGNLGQDPEVRYLDNGVAVANFSLATTENYKNKQGERVSQTEWHNIVLWRGLAEVAEKYLKKGSSIYVEGKIRNRKWEEIQVDIATKANFSFDECNYTDNICQTCENGVVIDNDVDNNGVCDWNEVNCSAK